MQWLICLLFLSAIVSLRATEKAGPVLQRERQTSTVREISLKPLFAYSARGRRDPFAYDYSLVTTQAGAGRDLSITELRLVGFIGTADEKTALFYNYFRRVSLRFRHGQLYGPEGVIVPNVKGVYLTGKQLSLTQGESNMIFELSSNSKIQSLDATIAHDRKEQQR